MSSLVSKLCDGNPFIKYTDYTLFRRIRVKEMAEVQKEARAQPLFRVRSSLRELKNAGFVEETDNKYRLSESGKKVAQ
jgi:predicted transcriptional regulator